MGLRFRKSFGLLKGVKLNISKSRGSLSFGKKGFTVNIGKDGARTTVGLPGSGLSYSEYSSYSKSKRRTWVLIVAVIMLAAIAFYFLSQ